MFSHPIVALKQKMVSVQTIRKILSSKWKCPVTLLWFSPEQNTQILFRLSPQEKRQSIKANRLAKNVLVLACNKVTNKLTKVSVQAELSLSVTFASKTIVSLHYSVLVNNTKSGYFTSSLPFSLHSVAGTLEQSLDGRELEGSEHKPTRF